MSKSSFEHMDCGIAQSLDIIGEWWSLLIIRNAFHGMKTFDDFHKQLGIASNILADRLKKMTDAGVFEKVKSIQDKRVYEYRLSEKGQELYPVIIALHNWGEKWSPDPKGPRMVLRDKKTGEEIRPVGVYAQDGRELSAKDVRSECGPGAGQTAHDLIGHKHSS